VTRSIPFCLSSFFPKWIRSMVCRILLVRLMWTTSLLQTCVYDDDGDEIDGNVHPIHWSSFCRVFLYVHVSYRIFVHVPFWLVHRCRCVPLQEWMMMMMMVPYYYDCCCYLVILLFGVECRNLQTPLHRYLDAILSYESYSSSSIFSIPWRICFVFLSISRYEILFFLCLILCLMYL
jgi:hypothetical protein